MGGVDMADQVVLLQYWKKVNEIVEKNILVND